MKIILTVILAIFLTGCVTTLPSYKFKSKTRIGLVLQPHKPILCHTHVGFTVFSNFDNKLYDADYNYTKKVKETFKRLVGENGHIGFNEPSSRLASRTRVKTLSPQTIANNAHFFKDSETQPQLAVTMGIGTIMEAKKIILLAIGSQKKQAVADLVEGSISAFSPASILQMHPKAMVIIDKPAAEFLKLKNYYYHIEKVRQAF